MSSLLSDERLVRRAAGGEERAFAAIFDRYHQPLYRYCLAIVGDSQDAQDALQNTMLKVLRALPGEAREIKLKPWLYRIAHNESIDAVAPAPRHSRARRRAGRAGPSPAEELSARERLRQLLSDLDELPERQRGALVMRELAGLDFDGIATALGTSPAVARQTLYEARLSLHQMDEGRGMDCATVTQALSDGDGRVTRRRDIRAHLRACPDCRRFRAEIEGREQDLAALAPLPAVAAGGLLQALLGAGSGWGRERCGRRRRCRWRCQGAWLLRGAERRGGCPRHRRDRHRCGRARRVDRPRPAGWRGIEDEAGAAALRSGCRNEGERRCRYVAVNRGRAGIAPRLGRLPAGLERRGPGEWSRCG